MLFDEQSYLLNTKYGAGMIESRVESKNFFSPGVSYEEKSIGTNAVSMVKVLKKPVYLYPRFHYCIKLKKWHEYCIPIKVDGEIYGCLSVVSVKHPIPKILDGFLTLLGAHLEYEFSLKNSFDPLHCISVNHLTNKQKVILKMIAHGLSDEFICTDLKLSLPTVKYHNQVIFKKLKASCRVDAVVKGLISNEITIADLMD